MLCQPLGNVAEVALVRDVENGVASLGGVVLLLQSKCPLLKAKVGSFFFSARKETDALGRSSIAGCCDGVPHLGCSILLVLEELQSVAA